MSVLRTAASLKNFLSKSFLQLEQPRVWSLRRLRACVSNMEWYCCHSEADSLSVALVHVSILLQTSLRLQRETASSSPAIMLCSSGGMFRSLDLLPSVSASSPKDGYHCTLLPLLLCALHFGSHAFESHLAVISRVAPQICSHKTHLVCCLGLTVGGIVALYSPLVTVIGNAA